MQRKIAILIIGLTTLISSTQSAFAAYTENWEIKDFKAGITPDKNGSIAVNEQITADFTNESHRGIERSIPSEYTNGTKIHIDFADSPDWSNNVYSSNGYKNLQLTTPDDSQLTAQSTFDINYRAEDAVLFQENNEELYWNVNGTDWVVPTDKISAKINLPPDIDQSKLDFICFTGTYGSRDQNCDYQLDSDSVTFYSTVALAPYEGLTIAVQYPKGTFQPLSTLEKIWRFLKQEPWILLPLLTLLLMLGLHHKYGRDEKTKKDTIIPHYTPPKDLLPSETGTIIDENLDSRDITATIIHHAIKGEIQIIDHKNDYEFKLKKPYTSTKPYEKQILEGIFAENKTGESVKLSDLTNKFYVHLKGIEKSIMEQLVKEDYFPTIPTSIRAKYAYIGGAIIFFGIYAAGAVFSLTVSMVISGLIVILVGLYMPRKTVKGSETYFELKGLYEYINTAEKDRLKFQEDNNIIFEKLLPYAMAFGTAKKWAKAFDGLITDSPKWYTAQQGTNFNMIYFADRLNNVDHKFTSTIQSRPGGKGGNGAWSGGSGFGGGGFSGGGFGGGGGHGL